MEVFVINLDRRPDRMAAMTKMLKELDIKFERLSAVDGQSFNVWAHTNRFKMLLYHELWWPPAGAVACYLSHRRVWEDIVRRELVQATIFEDDVSPTDFDPAIFGIDLAATGLDQLRLEGSDWTVPARILTRPFSLQLPLPGWQAMSSHYGGTGCYILTLQGAEKLLNAGKFWFPVDHFDILERTLGLRTAVLRPKMFIQSDSNSDIQPHPRPNELLPNILKDFTSATRPPFPLAAMRLLQWVKGAGRDIWWKILHALGYPFKKVLLIYVDKNAAG